MRSLAFRRTSKVPQHKLGRDILFVDTDGVLKKIDPQAEVTEIGASSTGPAILAHGNGSPHNGENSTWLLSPGDSFPYSGTFRFSFDGDETTDIDVEVDTPSDVQTKLEALPSIGSGNIIVTGNGSDPLYPGAEFDFEFTGDLGEQIVDMSSLAVTHLNVLVGSSPSPADPENWVPEPDQSGGPPNPPAVVNIYVDDTNGTVWVNTAFGSDSPNWIQSDLQSVQNLLAENYIPQGGPLTENFLGEGWIISGIDQLLAITKVEVGGVAEDGRAQLGPGSFNVITSETNDNNSAVKYARFADDGNPFFDLKNDGRMFFKTLATTDPNEAKRLWNDSGRLALSNGGGISSAKLRSGNYEGTNVLIPNGDTELLNWVLHSGSALLDLTNPLSPVVLVEGIYSICLSIICEALTADGSYQVQLFPNTPSFDELIYTDSPLSKASNLNTPRATCSAVTFISAGHQIVVKIKNKDGAAAVNFRIFRALISKL